MQHYYAVAEPDETGGFWISFPERPGLTSAAANAAEIVGQAQDALDSLQMYPPSNLPRSIEEGAKPPADLGNYDRPLVVVIPFEPASTAKAA